MQKLWIILISIGLLGNICIAQQTKFQEQEMYSWDFYEYLNKSGFHEDALTWLLSYPDSLRNDTLNNKINFEISRHYFFKNQILQANNHLKKISQFKDRASLAFAIDIAFLASDTALVDHYNRRFRQFLTSEDIKSLSLCLKMIKGERIDSSDIPRASESSLLMQTVSDYSLHKKKSPLLAGLLSTIVPGLGKWYLGYKHQALSSFIMNSALIAVTLEWFCKSNGLIRWILPLPVAAVFYSGNIVGSVLLARKREIDFQNNLNENIKAYYRNKLLAYQ